MCVSPCLLPELGEVACRKCWQCRENRVNDLVGRCIAERETSNTVASVTLTYKGDVPEAATLTYRDFQRFLKRLRKAGHKVRYIVAGEYGSKKGRAHWHCILFFKNSIELPKFDRNVNWEFWPAGYSFFQEVSYKGLRYQLKYVLKDDDQSVQRCHYSLSKRPPIGAEYFAQLAQQFVDNHLAPTNPSYSFSDIRTEKGKIREYHLQGVSLQIFLNKFFDLWNEEIPHRPVRPNEWLLPFYDKWVDDQLLTVIEHETGPNRVPTYFVGKYRGIEIDVKEWGPHYLTIRYNKGELWHVVDKKTAETILRETKVIRRLQGGKMF